MRASLLEPGTRATKRGSVIKNTSPFNSINTDG
jgi:hypothetical protein